MATCIENQIRRGDSRIARCFARSHRGRIVIRPYKGRCTKCVAVLFRVFIALVQISTTTTKKRHTPCPILRHLCRTVGVTASHIAKSVLLVFCDACHSFLLAFSATGSARKRPSRAGGNRRSVRPRQHQRKKGIPPIGGMPFFWRSRRDLNSRAGYPAYALSRGASSANLSTTP